MPKMIYFVLCFLIRVDALEAPDTLFVVKTLGDTLRGAATIEVRPFRDDLVLINGDSLPIKEVAAISNEDGFYMPAGKGYPSDALAKRVSDGKTIDLFVHETMSFHHHTLGGNMGNASVWMVKSPDNLLYSKMDRRLKDVEYDNLLADFWESPASREMLRQYQWKRRLMFIGFIGGFASILAAGPLGDDNLPLGLTFALAGVVGIGTGVYQSSTKNRCLLEAVRRYDR